MNPCTWAAHWSASNKRWRGISRPLQKSASLSYCVTKKSVPQFCREWSFFYYYVITAAHCLMKYGVKKKKNRIHWKDQKFQKTTVSELPSQRSRSFLSQSLSLIPPPPPSLFSLWHSVLAVAGVCLLLEVKSGSSRCHQTRFWLRN